MKKRPQLGDEFHKVKKSKVNFLDALLPHSPQLLGRKLRELLKHQMLEVQNYNWYLHMDVVDRASLEIFLQDLKVAAHFIDEIFGLNEETAHFHLIFEDLENADGQKLLQPVF